MGSLIQNIIMGLLIAKGNHALRGIEKIAPNYYDYYYNLLNKIIEENKDTVFGKQHNFSDIKNYEDYCKNIPLTDYSDYKNLVERISETCDYITSKNGILKTIENNQVGTEK